MVVGLWGGGFVLHVSNVNIFLDNASEPRQYISSGNICEAVMTADDLFGVASGAVLPGWLILMLAPRGRWAGLDLVPSLILPLGLSALY